MADSKKHVAIPGSERAALPEARVIGAADASERIEVTLLLRPNPSRARLSLANDLANQLPHERRHLSREEFEAAHGADADDLRTIEAFAQEYGLAVVESHPSARTIVLSGTVRAFSDAFNVTLQTYEHASGTYRGRTGPVHIPGELEGIVQGVFGLDNRPQAKPHHRLIHEQGGAWPNAQGVSYLPTQVASLYAFPTTGNGQGQCVAIIELGGGYNTSDLQTYFQQLGINMPNVTAISVGGAHNLPTGSPDGPDGEVMLDIEVAGSVAPGAHIAVYFAKNTDAGFLRAVNQAIHDKVRKPSV
ncbi:MAG: S53 family peptidase, partial [Candidatus Dormibacteraceae bacterium]